MVSQAEKVQGISEVPRWRIRALAVAGAVAAAVAVWVVGEPLLGHDLVIEQPGQDVQDLGVSAVVFLTLVSSLLAWGLLAVLERVTAARAALIWTVAALVVLAASFVPLVGVEATGGSKAVLGLLHLVVAAVLIPGFRWTATRRTAGARG